MDNKNKESNTSINDYQFHIKIKDEGDLRAIVALQYKDIKIKGFRIVRSKYKNNEQELWLQVPSYRTGNFYHKMFFVENENTWSEIEKKAFKVYKEEYDKYYKKKFGLKHHEVDVEEMSVDDIPF